MKQKVILGFLSPLKDKVVRAPLGPTGLAVFGAIQSLREEMLAGSIRAVLIGDDSKAHGASQPTRRRSCREVGILESIQKTFIGSDRQRRSLPRSPWGLDRSIPQESPDHYGRSL